MKVTPVPDEAVLLLEASGKRAGSERILVLADLHIGYESSLVKSGVRLPSQTDRKAKHLMKVLRRTKADRVVILGDIKHKITGISFQEREEVPRFFERLLEKVKAVDVVIGNHDAGLKELLPEAVSVHQNLVIGDVGLTHGHIWPSKEVMACNRKRHCLLDFKNMGRKEEGE